MISDRALYISHEYNCDKTLLFVPSPRSSIKFKYQGHSFRKMAVAGTLVFYKHSLFSLCPYSPTILQKVPGLVLEIFPCLEAFDCNTTSDWLNQRFGQLEVALHLNSQNPL